ncbi:MAG: CHAP domain-containing protein, partial [Synergistaceae bacterium]|nr:CHAP domain-containing protein [Synergistaceae bacterium]
LHRKITDYSKKIDYAADNYDWNDQEIAKWTSALGDRGTAAAGAAGAAAGGGIPSNGPANISAPNLNGAAYAEYRGENGNYFYQCVGYAKGRLQENLGISLGSWGNGGDAVSNLNKQYAGKTVKGLDGSEYSVEYCTPDNIKAGSIASFNSANSAGHVVYVEDVWTDAEGTQWVRFSEANADNRSDGGGSDGKILPPMTLDDFKNYQNGLKDLLHFEKV